MKKDRVRVRHYETGLISNVLSPLDYSGKDIMPQVMDKDVVRVRRDDTGMTFVSLFLLSEQSEGRFLNTYEEMRSGVKTHEGVGQ